MPTRTRARCLRTAATHTRKRRGGRIEIEFYNPTMVTRAYRERVADEGRALLQSLTVIWSDPQLRIVDVVIEEALLGERYGRTRGERLPHPCYAKVDRSRLRVALRIAESAHFFAAEAKRDDQHMEFIKERWAEWAKTLKAVLATMRKRRWSWVAVGCV